MHVFWLTIACQVALIIALRFYKIESEFWHIVHKALLCFSVEKFDLKLRVSAIRTSMLLSC